MATESWTSAEHRTVELSGRFSHFQVSLRVAAARDVTPGFDPGGGAHAFDARSTIQQQRAQFRGTIDVVAKNNFVHLDAENLWILWNM